jgi:hypothetical protein
MVIKKADLLDLVALGGVGGALWCLWHMGIYVFWFGVSVLAIIVGVFAGGRKS